MSSSSDPMLNPHGYQNFGGGYGMGKSGTYTRSDGAVINKSTGQMISGPAMGHAANEARRQAQINNRRNRSASTSIGTTGTTDTGYGSTTERLAREQMDIATKAAQQKRQDIGNAQSAGRFALETMRGQMQAEARQGQQEQVDALYGGLGAQNQQIEQNLSRERAAAASYGTAYGNLLQSMEGSTEDRFNRLQPQVTTAANQGRVRARTEARQGEQRISNLALNREQFMRNDIATAEQKRTENVKTYENAIGQFRQDRGAALDASLERRMESAHEFGKSEKENIANALRDHTANVVMAGAAQGFNTSRSAEMAKGLIKSLEGTTDVNFKKQQLMDAATQDWTQGTLQTADAVLSGKKNVSDIRDRIVSEASKAREGVGSATTSMLVTAMTGYNEAVLAATNTQSKQVVDFVKDKVLKINDAERDLDDKQIAALQLMGNLDMKIVESASKSQLDALSKTVDKIGEAMQRKTSTNLDATKTNYTQYLNLVIAMSAHRLAAAGAKVGDYYGAYGQQYKGLDAIYGRAGMREQAALNAATR